MCVCLLFKDVATVTFKITHVAHNFTSCYISIEQQCYRS